MNKKQKTILKNILDKFKLPHKITFIQYRNLNEFMYFDIEKINPTHKILLYGRLKKNRKMIKVGQIIITSLTISLNLNVIISNIDFICLILNMFFLSSIIFYLSNNVNILKEVYNYVKEKLLLNIIPYYY